MKRIMDVRDKVKQIIANCLDRPAEELDFEADMQDIEGWDSMHNVMVLARIEKEFDIMIPDDDIFELTTIGAYADEVLKLIGEKR